MSAYYFLSSAKSIKNYKDTMCADNYTIRNKIKKNTEPTINSILQNLV